MSYKYNEENLFALSEAVAKIADVEPYAYLNDLDAEDASTIWLHEDSERCFDLGCVFEIDIQHNWNSVIAIYDRGKDVKVAIDEETKLTRIEATRIAILKAIVLKGSERSQ